MIEPWTRPESGVVLFGNAGWTLRGAWSHLAWSEVCLALRNAIPSWTPHGQIIMMLDRARRHSDLNTVQSKSFWNTIILCICRKDCKSEQCLIMLYVIPTWSLTTAVKVTFYTNYNLVWKQCTCKRAFSCTVKRAFICAIRKLDEFMWCWEDHTSP